MYAQKQELPVFLRMQTPFSKMLTPVSSNANSNQCPAALLPLRESVLKFKTRQYCIPTRSSYQIRV